MAEAARKVVHDCGLNPEVIERAATLAARLAKPLDNTDFEMSWRKKVATEFVTYALRELRGDDMGAERLQLTRHDWDGIS